MRVRYPAQSWRQGETWRVHRRDKGEGGGQEQTGGRQAMVTSADISRDH